MQDIFSTCDIVSRVHIHGGHFHRMWFPATFFALFGWPKYFTTYNDFMISIIKFNKNSCREFTMIVKDISH